VSLNTILSTLAKGAGAAEPIARIAAIAATVGNVNLAMLISAAIAMITLQKLRHLDRRQMSDVVETSLLSGGMTLPELAELMVAEGAHHAYNLDGGGSSTMVVQDTVVNSPSDGRERSNSDGLLFFARGG